MISYNLLRSQRSKGGQILGTAECFFHKRDLILTIDNKTGTIALSKDRQQLFYPIRFCRIRGWQILEDCAEDDLRVIIKAHTLAGGGRVSFELTGANAPLPSG